MGEGREDIWPRTWDMVDVEVTSVS